MAGVVVTGQIGTVELKDGAADIRAKVSPANIGRLATDNVLLVQTIDASGNVGTGGGTIGSASFTKITDGTDTADVVDLATEVTSIVYAGKDALLTVGLLYAVAPTGTFKPLIMTVNDNLQMDITEQSLTALKVSATAAANATANRIYTHGNIDQIGGGALGLGEDNAASSIPVVLASDKYVRVSKDTNVNAAANPLFAELTDGAAVISTSNPLSVNLVGLSGESIAVLATIGDNLALSTNALVTASAMFGYDGATLDMLRTDATGGLVTGRNWLLAGEDAGNDWVKSKKEQTAVSCPAKTTTTVTALQDILASREIQSDPGFTVFVDNTGAAALTALNIEVSPDGTTWVGLTAAGAAGYGGMREDAWSATLAAGVMCSYSIFGNTYRYLRVQANCGTTTNIDCWYLGSKQ